MLSKTMSGILPKCSWLVSEEAETREKRSWDVCSFHLCGSGCARVSEGVRAHDCTCALVSMCETAGVNLLQS